MRTARAERMQQLFPDGVPRLWCPTLTFFRAAREPCPRQMASHLQRLSPYVKGILVPGSTGEGWQMSDEEIANLLDMVLPLAHAQGIRVLIGILKTQTAQVLTAIDHLSDKLTHPAVVGITVCGPQGSELTQEQLSDGLSQVLERGIPTALYQLPQVTQNELAPQTVANLASAYSNFLFFKDTSGRDVVANSQVDLGGVFMLRGSEQQGYARWLSAAGVGYDGFLLSTANVFAPQLHRIIECSLAGAAKEAAHLSDHLQEIVAEAFNLVQTFPYGNAFTNANKLMLHLQLYGIEPSAEPLPMLVDGQRLPAQWLIELDQRCPQLRGQATTSSTMRPDTSVKR